MTTATAPTIEAPTEALAVIVYRDESEALSAIQSGVIVAPSGVLAEVQAGALVHSEESAAVLAEAHSLAVTSPADFARALEIVKRGKAAGKDADEERMSYVGVINPVVKWINDAYRSAIADGKAAANEAWTKAQNYEREEKRKADEAARKAREEQERAERKLREEAEAKRAAEEQARQREEEAHRKAEEAAAAGNREAQERANAEAEAARKEAERAAAAAKKREEKAEVVAAAPAYIPPAATGMRKGSGVGAGRKVWRFDWSDPGAPEACLLLVVKAAAGGNVAALRCLDIDASGARLQAQAGAAVPGLRFWSEDAAPSVRR